MPLDIGFYDATAPSGSGFPGGSSDCGDGRGAIMADRAAAKKD
jgi:hypothetical protein